MGPTPLSVHVLLLFGQLCFASLPVVGLLAMGRIKPAAIVLVRMTGGAIAFSLLARARGGLRIDRKDVPFLLLCSFLGVAANQELFIQGLSRSTATNASVLGATIPVFTALVAIVLKREPARPRRLIGIAIACAGAGALVGADRLSTSPEHLLGSGMVLLNSLSYGTYLVIVRPLAQRYEPMTLLAWLFIAGVPMVAPLGVIGWLDSPPLGASDVAFLAFLVLVPTVLAYGVVQTALKRVESTLVAAYIYLQPVFATLGATLVLGEQPTIRTAICGAIIFLGVWLAARSRS